MRLQAILRKAIHGLFWSMFGLTACPVHAQSESQPTLSVSQIRALTQEHSGHNGNFVPNPAFHLAHILSSMKPPDGRVLIDGFYDGIEIDDELRDTRARVPDDIVAIKASMGIAETDVVAASLQESLQYPSLNVRGLSAAWVGQEVRTIIPATATAEIDVRLVKEPDPDRLVKLVRQHVEEPILIRTAGGSIPIAPVVDTLGIPAAIVPTVNIDNNQHSPAENLRLGNFIEGIAIILSVLSQSTN